MPTVGVPIAAAMCMGAESTPTKSRARAVSAASSLSDSWPERSRVGAGDVRRCFAPGNGGTPACTAAISAFSFASGADVSTMGSPSPPAHRTARQRAPPAST
jgi:hypothetical protein